MTKNLPREKTGLDGDGGKLRHGGIGHHASIGKKQNAIIAVCAIVEFNDRAGGHDIRKRQGFHQVEHRPQKTATRGTGATRKGIRQTILKHHSRKIIRPGHNLTTVLQLDLPVSFDSFQSSTEGRKVRGFFGIDNCHMVQANRVAPGDLLDDIAAPEQDGNAELFLVKKFCRLYHTTYLAIWKHDPFWVSPDFFKNCFYESHAL